jgi:hypothetical protein
MESITQLEAQVLPITKIVIRDGKKTTEYQLVLDYNAIAKAQELIKRDLSQVINWKDLSGSDLSTVCFAAFDRFHPEVTLREVRQWLAPAQNNQLFEMLFGAAYPGVLERLIEAAKDAPEGPPSPNAKAAART